MVDVETLKEFSSEGRKEGTEGREKQEGENKGHSKIISDANHRPRSQNFRR